MTRSSVNDDGRHRVADAPAECPLQAVRAEHLGCLLAPVGDLLGESSSGWLPLPGLQRCLLGEVDRGGVVRLAAVTVAVLRGQLLEPRRDRCPTAGEVAHQLTRYPDDLPDRSLVGCSRRLGPRT